MLNYIDADFKEMVKCLDAGLNLKQFEQNNDDDYYADMAEQYVEQVETIVSDIISESEMEQELLKPYGFGANVTLFPIDVSKWE